MTALVPLSPAQIAELYGAVNENVGTGDNSNKDFQLDFFPVVNGETVTDELVAFGDGVTAVYTLGFPPIDSGSLELRVDSILGTLLVDPTDYSVDLTTGVVTLTGSGITAITNKELHAKYTSAGPLQLQVGPITVIKQNQRLVSTGTPLVLTTDYTFSRLTGAVTLTDAGVTALGTSDLHGLYEINSGMVNILKESNASLRQNIARNNAGKFALDAKDDTLKFIHETIESKTIAHLEDERRALQDPTTIINSNGNFVLAAEVVTETKIFDSVNEPYQLSLTAAPLYPAPSLSLPGPDAGNPRWPSGGVPRYSEGLDGGTGNDTANEENQLAIELTNNLILYLDGNTNAVRAASAAGIALTAAVDAQLTALSTQITALTDFLNDNPVANDHISAGDIADANTALTNAQAQDTLVTAYRALLNTPFTGFSDANLLIQNQAVTGTIAVRDTYITGTRVGELDTLLASLYNKRFFWISERARIGDGTLSRSVGLTKSNTKAADQITKNDARIDEILDILEAQ